MWRIDGMMAKKKKLFTAEQMGQIREASSRLDDAPYWKVVQEVNSAGVRDFQTVLAVVGAVNRAHMRRDEDFLRVEAAEDTRTLASTLLKIARKMFQEHEDGFRKLCELTGTYKGSDAVELYYHINNMVNVLTSLDTGRELYDRIIGRTYSILEQQRPRGGIGIAQKISGNQERYMAEIGSRLAEGRLRRHEVVMMLWDYERVSPLVAQKVAYAFARQAPLTSENPEYAQGYEERFRILTEAFKSKEVFSLFTNVEPVRSSIGFVDDVINRLVPMAYGIGPVSAERIIDAARAIMKREKTATLEVETIDNILSDIQKEVSEQRRRDQG